MEKLKYAIEILFNRYWDEDLTEDEEDALDASAEAVVSEYGWEAVLLELQAYLIANADSPEKAVNTAHIFWDLRWSEKPIPNPYDFIGLFYYCVNMETDKFDGSDILDSIATTILPKNGVQAANLYLNPYYMPENDPEIKAAVERWRNIVEKQ